ncbi:MAG: hypothetical protein ACOZBH_03440 [Patescibacteria group bacterium]
MTNKRPEMQSEKLKKKSVSQSTQLFLDISEIRNNTVILKDGTLRAVILVSSVNFALKSEEEQQAIVAAYVGFLNYLDHPIQIVIQSRKLNIEGYIARLHEREKEVTNELLKKQIDNYIQYVQELVELGDIMSKRFFLVVPYSPLEEKAQAKPSGFFSKLSALFTPGQVIKLKKEKFEKYYRQLMQRVDHIQGNLNSMGLKSAQLDTQGLIELYYNVYNPGMAEQQQLSDVEKLRLET